jgi:hypothetical protein
MRVRFSLRTPKWLDEWMWKHVRWYKRREMRRAQARAVSVTFSPIEVAELSRCWCGALSLPGRRLCGVCRQARMEAESDMERDRR